MAHVLDEIRDAMAEVERLEGLLEAAKERRTQLATRLYMQNGPTRTYQVVGELAGEGVELLVSRTKPRRDGTVSYFFAEKQRWKGKPASEAPIALTGRVIEATATLTGRGQAGPSDVKELEERYGTTGELPLDQACSVCGGLQFATPSGVSCPNGHGGVPSQAEIQAAMEQGARDSAAIRASRGGVRLPIVGEGRPEPRLLQIAQPRGLRPVTQDPETGVWRVPLTQGQIAIVDEEDVEFVGRWNWQAHCATKTRDTEQPKYYGRRYVGKEEERQVHELMHRAIGSRFLPLTDELEIDHKNGNGLDNRRANLRVATRGQNMQNVGAHETNTSGFKGVRLKEGRWIAQFSHEGEYHHIGSFATPEEAHAAYIEATRDTHGEFANPGEPQLLLPSEPDIDPDQAILDELLAALD